jgi:hypothetical protein
MSALDDDDLFEDVQQTEKKRDRRPSAKTSRGSMSKQSKEPAPKPSRKKLSTNIHVEEIPQYTDDMAPIHDSMTGKAITGDDVLSSLTLESMPVSDMEMIGPKIYFKEKDRQTFEDICIYQMRNGTYAIDINDLHPHHVIMTDVKTRLPIKTMCQHIGIFNAAHGKDRNIDPVFFCINEKYVTHKDGEYLKVFIVNGKGSNNIFMMIVTTEKRHARILARKFIERIKSESVVLSSTKSWINLDEPTRFKV